LINLLLDFLLLVITLGIIWTTCLLKIVFPVGTRADGWTLWGLDYDGWSNVQTGLLAVVALAIVIHVMLHWTWVCSSIRTRLLGRSGKLADGTQTLYGVATLVVLVAATTGLLVAAELTVRQP
jgi:hypothetical protein